MPFALPVLILIRLIRPFLLVRLENIGPSMGPLALHPEIYLCEQEVGVRVPKKRYKDIFYSPEIVCNYQMFKMWKRVIFIWPYWTFGIVAWLNDLIPGGSSHKFCFYDDRDVNNLLEKTKPHVNFSIGEEERGRIGLSLLGIPEGSPFVCFLVRDGAYGDLVGSEKYHRLFRNTDIDNYVLAMEALVNRGYYVIRMGATASKPLNTFNSKIIDYAMNGMRSEFMDVYLGSKCAFCVTTSSGWDAIVALFRRPLVITNQTPAFQPYTHLDKILITFKKHINSKDGRELSLSEIFSVGAGFFGRTYYYDLAGIELIENSPKEICDVVIEMAERLDGSWKHHEDDEALQRRFWEIFPTKSKRLILENYPCMIPAIPVEMFEHLDGRYRKYDEDFKKRFWEIFPAAWLEPYSERPIHGEIRARFGAHYLRNNQGWLK
ncbi:MAG: TIGR04372 family glycosyltransferase [Deltaproteobacteria bacterium]|nr:TIGR04372 family glycosyltransferase [Deltaproteobacteria bacterium]